MQTNRFMRSARVLLGASLMLVLLAGVAVPMQTAHATQTLYFAKPGGLTNGTCDSWAHACQLRWALPLANFAAAAGSVPVQVWVQAGTHKPNAPSDTDRGKSFQLLAKVSLYGGFAGTETLLSQRNPTANVTILSGDMGTVGEATDNSYHVVTIDLPAADAAVLDGFQIVGGRATGSSGMQMMGAGLLIKHGTSTLRNLKFVGNHASLDGGGLYNDTGGRPTLNNVTFDSNYAGWGGGGAWMYGTSPALTNVTFLTNSTGHNGGGMHIDVSGMATLTNVVFDGNETLGQGGGLDILEAGTLRNVTFSNNVAHYGGGLDSGSDNLTVTNSTFFHNEATSKGGGMCSCSAISAETLTNVTFSGNINGAIWVNGPTRPTVKNSILWNDGTPEVVLGGAVISNSIVQGGCPNNSTCTGLVNGNPQLGPLQNNGGYPKTMAPGAGSYAIDRGNDATCTARDQRGVLRPQGVACDIGAYEVKAMTLTSTAANDGWVKESSEGSGVGGTLNSTNATLLAGDDATNRQVLSVLSFNTGGLPDAAAVVLGRVRIKQVTITGAPFGEHGTLLVDLANLVFGAEAGLVVSDFQAAGTTAAAGSFSITPVSGWYTGALDPAGRANINRLGTTQFRVRFSIDDNNDLAADTLAFSSGDDPTAANRPVLVVYYNP